MIRLDGSYGEGGGQILRSALALSMVTRKPFIMENIRARRSKPGLAPVHQVFVEAAAKVCKASVSGNEQGSKTLKFEPGITVPGWYEFSLGSRGATALLLQTLLPALMTAAGPSVLRFVGGTHVPLAPSVDFLQHAFLPHLKKFGPKVDIELASPGYYPSGGGRVNIDIDPRRRLNMEPLDLSRRGRLMERQVRILIANLNQNTARRQKEAFLAETHWDPACVVIDDIEQNKGPGNMICVILRYEHVTEVITQYGQMGDPPERAARKAAVETEFYMESEAAVGEHLADQLLLPMALAGGGRMSTTSPSLHTRTNMHIISQFLDNVSFDVDPHGDKAWMIHVRKKLEE